MFKIGDTEITREDMPAMTAFDMNPDHLAQGIQDILSMQLGMGMMQPQDGGQSFMNAQNTAEVRNDTWENK